MLTPGEISRKNFKKGLLGGYNMKDVDSYLAELSDAYDKLYKENIDFKDKMGVLSDGLQYYKSIEKTLQKALVLAQKTADENHSDALKRAENIEREAHIKAQKVLNDAMQQLNNIKEQAISMIRKFEVYKTQYKNLASSQLELLESDSFNLNGIDVEDAFNFENPLKKAIVEEEESLDLLNKERAILEPLNDNIKDFIAANKEEIIEDGDEFDVFSKDSSFDTLKQRALELNKSGDLDFSKTPLYEPLKETSQPTSSATEGLPKEEKVVKEETPTITTPQNTFSRPDPNADKRTPQNEVKPAFAQNNQPQEKIFKKAPEKEAPPKDSLTKDTQTKDNSFDLFREKNFKAIKEKTLGSMKDKASDAAFSHSKAAGTQKTPESKKEQVFDFTKEKEKKAQNAPFSPSGENMKDLFVQNKEFFSNNLSTNSEQKKSQETVANVSEPEDPYKSAYEKLINKGLKADKR